MIVNIMSAKPTEGASVIAGLRQVWPDFELTNYNQMNPTSDIAIKFYDRFVCGQLQIEINDLQQTLINHSSCADAFRDILNIYALYMCTETVIKKLGLIELIKTFGLTDLLNPMRKKFKMSLILLSNCVLYAAGLQDIMEDIKNRILEALKNNADAQKKINEVKEKINNAVIIHVKNVDKKDDLQKLKNSLLKQILSQEDILEKLEEEIKFKKNELSSVQDEYELSEANLHELSVTEQKLNSLIVDDHQSIICEKERLIKDISDFKLESDEYDTIMNKKMHTIYCYQENLNIINNFLGTLPLSELLDKYEIINKFNSEIEKLQIEIKSIQETESIALKQIQDINNLLEQKVKAYILKNDNRMKDIHNEIQDLKNQLEQEQEKFKITLESFKQIDDQIQGANECLQKQEQNIEKQNHYYDQKYKEILELKGQLDNKVMSIINFVVDELNSKK